MAKNLQNRNFTVVELAQGIFVQTPIPPENHSALRAGFAGYTANPRWGANKFLAWKMGRQWRSALDRQEMVVRAHDAMLIPRQQAEQNPDPPASPTSKSHRSGDRNLFRRLRFPVPQS